MGDIQYNTDQENEFGRSVQSRGFDMVGLVIRTGLAGDRRTAEYVLLGLAGVAILIGIVTWRVGFSGSSEEIKPAMTEALLPGTY